MHGELVQTTTIDSVRLHGLLLGNTRDSSAWILVHGVNSNFYSSSLLQSIASYLVNRGQCVLMINTRGHDIASFNTGSIPKRLGSQFETVSSCEHDLNAWYGLLVDRGAQFVSVLGHSLGAIKSVYWASRTTTPLEHIVAVSPPRLNTSHLLLDPAKGAQFQKHLDEAQEWCNTGKPEHVMKVRFPLPMWICASTYLDKYGSKDKYDYLTFLSAIRSPTLWTFGQLEMDLGTSNFKNAASNLNSAIASQGSNLDIPHTVVTVPNADHSYNEARDSLLVSIAGWLEPQ
jgi:pimeloyl-ACP methyl ester carboxylesterase